ncbi:MAG TPA: YkvA family protein [Flavitalea sp.]|nr:YkvA family protein [Flavitalea sp.]
MVKSSLKTKWSLKHQILTLFYAFKDDRMPWYAKITALLSLIYLVSPADIVPDIIPFAGYIDDLFIVPFLINLSTTLLPAEIRINAEQRARARGKKIFWVLIIIVLALAAGLYFIFRH